MLSDSDSSFQDDSPLKKAATSVSQDFLSNCGLPGANQSASLPSDSSLPPKKIALSVSPCLTGQCSMSEIDDSCESAIAVYQICQFFCSRRLIHSRLLPIVMLFCQLIPILITLSMYQSRTMYSRILRLEAVFQQLA